MTSRSSTITRRPRRHAPTLPAVAPGEILLEEFLDPLKITQYRLAKDIGVPPRRINEIIQGKRAVTADTALRLARYFETSEKFWVNLQSHYDLEIAKERLGERLDREVKLRRAFHPPTVSISGDRVFVQLPDGRIERLTRNFTDEQARAVFDYLNAQGKVQDFVRQMLRAVEETPQRADEKSRTRAGRNREPSPVRRRTA